MMVEIRTNDVPSCDAGTVDDDPWNEAMGGDLGE